MSMFKVEVNWKDSEVRHTTAFQGVGVLGRICPPSRMLMSAGGLLLLLAEPSASWLPRGPDTRLLHAMDVKPVSRATVGDSI